MRNIPVFTGEFGAATLILQEIPGRGEAYCVVQWVQPGKTWEFLAECARFCRMAGARRVLASHLPEPPAAPPQVRLLRMACLVRRAGDGRSAVAPSAGKRRRISADLQRGHVRRSGGDVLAPGGFAPAFGPGGRIFCPQGRSASGNWPGEWGYAPVPGLLPPGGRARCGGGAHFGDAGGDGGASGGREQPACPCFV